MSAEIINFPFLSKPEGGQEQYLHIFRMLIDRCECETCQKANSAINRGEDDEAMKILFGE